MIRLRECQKDLLDQQGHDDLFTIEVAPWYKLNYKILNARGSEAQ
jgi:hypothetical protein